MQEADQEQEQEQEQDEKQRAALRNEPEFS
jgi:hypothetical protein